QARRDSNPQQAVLETAALADWSYWPKSFPRSYKNEKNPSGSEFASSEEVLRSMSFIYCGLPRLLLLFMRSVLTAKRAKLFQLHPFGVKLLVLRRIVVSTPTSHAFKINDLSHV